MKLSNAQEITHASQLIGDDVEFTGINTDTRHIKSGELFIAIEGDNFDGHDFIAEAKEKGAMAAIVSQPSEVNINQLVVSDTRIAYGQLAANHRDQFNCPVVAITGSCGKTTTKEMTAAILRQSHNVLSPQRSYNNDIGVPLTLLQLREEHEFAVMEIGANHPGEIAQLVTLVKPQVAAITMIGAAHIEGFGSEQGVADAKGEIYSGLAANGVAVMPVDTKYATQWREGLTEQQLVITFGVTEANDVWADDITSDRQGYPRFTLVLPQERLQITLPIQGKHNINNALVAASISLALSVPAADIQAGLNQFIPVAGRLTRRSGMHGSIIIDDSYNAIPQAVMAAIDLLASLPGKRIFVFGDMKELGPAAEDFHRKIGEYAKQAKVDQLFTYGQMSRLACEAHGATAEHFSDKKALVAKLTTQLDADTIVLIKGSRAMQMEHIVNDLVIN